MKMIPIGAKVRVTGICITEDSNPFNSGVGFDILMRDFDDITVVAKPSMVNTRNLTIAVSLLLLVVIVVGGWGWMLRRKVGQQTATLATMAQFEQRRSMILEKINGSDPLGEILSEITSMVSLMLGGIHCRCEIASGTADSGTLLNSDETSLSKVPIAGHGGVILGRLVAGIDPISLSAERLEALTVGARLASLAIETRRLYSDLRRRSEFDLLTEIHNRFSMEKALGAKIEESRATHASFGLIYIDLDKFKPINDTYGHHVGDLYLQEVAARMSKQLLGGDMLARLGGDEFAALVSLQHGRYDLEKIIARLESCFAEPFILEGHTIHGAASIGFAFYPENGTNRDELLNAADAAMYDVKKSKSHAKAEKAAIQAPNPSPSIT
jgi:diguanylate cyclase (GGDEF)-like protein